MSEQDSEFIGLEIEEDVEGHQDMATNEPEDDVEGHVQPPRGDDTDHVHSFVRQ